MAVHAGARPTVCCDWCTLGVTHGDPGHRAPGYRGGRGKGPVLAWLGLACGETGLGGHGRAKGRGLWQDTLGLSSVQGPRPGLSLHSPNPLLMYTSPSGVGCVCELTGEDGPSGPGMTSTGARLTWAKRWPFPGRSLHGCTGPARFGRRQQGCWGWAAGSLRRPLGPGSACQGRHSP